MRFRFLVVISLLLGFQAVSADEYEQYADANMRRGIALLAPEAVNGVGVKIDTLRFEENLKAPVWRLCSWNFATKLSGDNPTQTEYGITYADDAYLFARDDEDVFTMQVESSKVYQSPRTSSSQPWINFLVETDFDNIPLGKCGSVVLTYSMRVQRCRKMMANSVYNTSIHAAQFLGYLSIRNNNQSSADCGKYLWLGVGIFDNRNTRGISTSTNCSWDVGTNTYIFSMNSQDIFGSINMKDFKWHDAQVDVKAGVQQAITTLREKGFLTDSQVSDFVITGMNFGWELPGTFDVIGQFRNFSLRTDVDLKKVQNVGTQSVTLPNGPSAYVTPAALDFTDVWNVDAFIVQRNATGDGVHLLPVERVPAGTPLILNAKDEGTQTYQIPLLDTANRQAEDVSTNLLQVATNGVVPAMTSIRSSDPLLTDASQLSTNSIDTTVDGDGVGVNERGTTASDLYYLIDGLRDHVIMFRPDDYGGQVGATAPWYVQCQLPQAEKTLYIVMDQLGGYGTHIDKLVVQGSNDGIKFTNQSVFSGEKLHALRTDINLTTQMHDAYSYVRIYGTNSSWGVDGWGLRELQLYGTVPGCNMVWDTSSTFRRLEADLTATSETIYFPLSQPLLGDNTYVMLDIPTAFPTAINLPCADQSTPIEGTYNLLGQRTSTPAHGLFIQDGRKVLKR